MMIRIGFVQTSPTFGAVEENLERAGRLVLEAPAFDVLVLPELFSTGYLFLHREECLSFGEEIDGPTVSRMQDWARSRGGWVCGGFPERAGERVYNAAALVGPKGETHVYRKLHLFDRETLTFDPGDRPFEATPIATERGSVRVGMMICFDWIAPESARCLTLAGAEVLLHPSNLVLPNCPEAMKVRCFENRVYAITANRCGEEERGGVKLRFIGSSQIVDPESRVIERVGAVGQRVFVAEVDLAPAREKSFTPRNTLSSTRRPEMYGDLVK
jgi:predicted amidohydrolase